MFMHGLVATSKSFRSHDIIQKRFINMTPSPFFTHLGSWSFLLHLQIYPDDLNTIKQRCDVSHDISVSLADHYILVQFEKRNPLDWT
jgi:hypothetical protein